VKVGTASATVGAYAYDSTTGALTYTAATGTAAAAVASEIQTTRNSIQATKAAIAAHQANMDADTTEADYNTEKDLKTADEAELARLEAVLAKQVGTAAAAAVPAGDMTAYSGYQADVTLSTETDSGIKFTMGFDLEAGLMADQDDDREMDTKDGSIANSTLTMEANGYTLVIGQDEIDDLYDDSQNGDISLSGNMNGLSFTVVHDFEDSVVAKAATYKAAVAATTAATAADATYKAATFTDAVAAVHEGTSLSLGYTMGPAALSLVSTTANDRGNSATEFGIDYTVSDTLSFSVDYDTQGKRDAIATVGVTYAIDALTITAKYADDKNHAGNTNKDGKASTNLSVAYAQGPVSATFATDESNAWWINTQYDLGGGASAFATVDHQEFAVAGLSFAF